MKKILIFLILGVLSIGIAWHDAQATSIIAMSDDAMADAAEVIVQGTIVKVEPFQYDARTILTKVTTQVEDYLKAPDGTEQDGTYVFYTRGGQLGDVVQTVSGEFQAVEGKAVIVFLERIKKYGGLPMVLGLKTGAYWIEDAPEVDGRSERMTRERFARACGAVKPERVPLKDVRARIQKRVQKKQGGMK